MHNFGFFGMSLDEKNLDLQTGRRPSGVCGAALFIAAHIHGFERSKADVVYLLGNDVPVKFPDVIVVGIHCLIEETVLTLGLAVMRITMNDTIVSLSHNLVCAIIS